MKSVAHRLYSLVASTDTIWTTVYVVKVLFSAAFTEVGADGERETPSKTTG